MNTNAVKTTEFCGTRHYGRVDFLFTADGDRKVVESIALLIRGRGGRARVVKARDKPVFAVYAIDGGRPAARVVIDRFREQYETPRAE